MRLSLIVAKLKAANTRFENRIAGAAQLDWCLDNTFEGDTAFVVQIGESTHENEYDSGINQVIKERFAVIVALRNDLTTLDKLGIRAYDSLHDIRVELWAALLNWNMPETEEPIYYMGGNIFAIHRGYLWYQYNFETSIRITDKDGIDPGSVDMFDKIYAEYILTPDADIPYLGNLPASGVTIDMTQQVDLTQDLNAGGFSKGFSLGFDLYTG